MTLTRKSGAILLLLTAGSLLGSAAFAVFFARTSSDGMFLAATNLKQSLLQDLSIQALNIRTGDDSARKNLRDRVDQFSQLTDAMKEGGSESRAGRGQWPISVVKKVYSIAQDQRLPAAYSSGQLAALLSQQLPAPPLEIQIAARDFAEAWERSKPDFQVVAERPIDDPSALLAYRNIRETSEPLNQKSRNVSAAVALRIIRQRNEMLAVLASTAGLSVILFGIGLWFTRRYVVGPIEELKRASAEMRHGDFSHRVSIQSTDELALLGRTFNEMSEEISCLVERHRELFENAADFVYTTDLEGNFLSVNKAGESITGFSRAELQGKRADEIATPEHAKVLRQSRAQLLGRKEQTTLLDLEYVTRDGRRIFLDTSERLIVEGGKPVAIQGLARDITERKRLQEQLWAAQKMDMIGRLAGGIAHDFGNILTIITGYCALILATRPANDPICAEVKGIEKAAQRATAMIRPLVGFSGGQVFRPRIILPDAALTGMTDMVRRLIGEHIELRMEIRSGLAPIRIDPGQLEQVVVNLVLNARDAMKGGGVLTIEAKNEDLPASHIRITVRDSGTGMTPEVIARIFEPFFSTKNHGTGLGLSTAHSIVRQSDGSISVDSRPGEGTTFTLLFPCAPLASEVSGVKPEPLPQRGTETILLVEDETGVRQLIRDMLRFYGYNVVEATDQRHALELCSRHDVKLDLLLTDVMMPDMNGPEMVREIQPLRPELKIIYMSGHSRERYATAGLNLDTDTVIQKPVLAEVLTSRIREVLEA